MLDTSVYSLSGLFAQLGLPNSESDIEQFIKRYYPLPQAEPLANAAFWTESQATFLREALANDAEWAEVVDELNILLRD
jgi:hypothetical protein